MTHFVSVWLIIIFGSLYVNLSFLAANYPPECGSQTLLDLIFILDSSGSVYDEQYINWQSEIDFAKSIVNNSLPRNTKIGAINFSGCGPSYDFEQCKAQNRLKKMWGLNTYGVPYNDQQAVYDRFAAMGPADFNSGTTWTDSALSIALNEFNGNGSAYREKMVILVTDGQPYPYNQGHEPCKNSTGYISPTLASLRALGTTIIAIGIDVSQSAIDDFFSCITIDFNKYFFYVSDFYGLTHLTKKMRGLVCPTPAPTPAPTNVTGNPTTNQTAPTNTTQSPTTSPTPAPTNATADPTTNPTPAPTTNTTSDPTTNPTAAPVNISNPAIIIGSRTEEWEVGLTIGSSYNFVDIGSTAFNQLFAESGVIRRECPSCVDEYKLVYYRRISADLSTFDAYSNMKSWRSTNNVINVNFILTNDVNSAIYSEYNPSNPNYWQVCNYNDGRVGAFRDCGPNSHIGGWQMYCTINSHCKSMRFSILKVPIPPHWTVGLTIGNDYNYIDIGSTAFNQLFAQSGVMKRECQSCVDEYKLVYYRRISNDLSSFDAYSNMKSWRSTNNVINNNFILTNDIISAIYSDYNGSNTNYWRFCNYDDGRVGAFRDCGPNRFIGGWQMYCTINSNCKSMRFSILTAPTSSSTQPSSIFINYNKYHMCFYIFL